MMRAFGLNDDQLASIRAVAIAVPRQYRADFLRVVAGALGDGAGIEAALAQAIATLGSKSREGRA